MSASQHYTAQEYLPLFADKARANISGWGIGFCSGVSPAKTICSSPTAG
jgi:hypothetical protein